MSVDLQYERPKPTRELARDVQTWMTCLSRGDGYHAQLMRTTVGTFVESSGTLTVSSDTLIPGSCGVVHASRSREVKERSLHLATVSAARWSWASRNRCLGLSMIWVAVLLGPYWSRAAVHLRFERQWAYVWDTRIDNYWPSLMMYVGCAPGRLQQIVDYANRLLTAPLDLETAELDVAARDVLLSLEQARTGGAFQLMNLYRPDAAMRQISAESIAACVRRADPRQILRFHGNIRTSGLTFKVQEGGPEG